MPYVVHIGTVQNFFLIIIIIIIIVHILCIDKMILKACLNHVIIF